METSLNAKEDPSSALLAVTAKINHEDVQIGACFIDTLTKRISLCQFPDSKLYVQFRLLLQQHGIKECLLEPPQKRKGLDSDALRDIVLGCGVKALERRASDFNSKYLERAIDHLSSVKSALLFKPSLHLATRPAAALIRYLDLLSEPCAFGRYEVYEHNLSDYMTLNSSALNAVNLRFERGQDGLYRHLNRCKTSSGQLLLRKWLRHPSTKLEVINYRQQLVEAFFSKSELIKILRNHLQRLPRIAELIDRLGRGDSDRLLVTETHQAILCLRALAQSMKDMPDGPEARIIQEEFAGNLDSIYTEFETSVATINRYADPDALEYSRFEIKPEANDTLSDLREQSSKIKEYMIAEYGKANQAFREEDGGSIKLFQHHEYGWCFKLGGGGRQTTTLGPTWFRIDHQHVRTPTLTRLAEESTCLAETKKRTEDGIVNSIIELLQSHVEYLESASRLISTLDVMISFACVSFDARVPYIRPTMSSAGGNTVLKEARHPLLETKETMSFVSNEVYLDREKSLLSIITGPNMGGKSTYLRQLAIIVVMAQVGCFVPCGKADMCIFDGIFARVGGSDYQSKGASTFGAEMYETREILGRASANSLVLLDELGRATNASYGFAIARAICEKLVLSVKCFALFATHFHRLGSLSEEIPKVTSLFADSLIKSTPSSEFGGHRDCQVNQVLLTYKILKGHTKDSFGLDVAKALDFPEDIIARASVTIQIGKLSRGERIVIDQALIQVLSKWQAESTGSSQDQKLKKLNEQIQEHDMLRDFTICVRCSNNVANNMLLVDPKIRCSEAVSKSHANEAV